MTLLHTVPVWAMGHLLRKPVFWLWLLAGLGIWPLLTKFSGVGITTEKGTPQATIYEVAFMGIQVGGLLGMRLLDSSSALFLRTSPSRRFLAEAWGIGSACLLTVAAGLIFPTALGLMGSNLHPSRLPLHTLWAVAAYVPIAMVLLHFPIGTRLRTALLPFLTWFLPALVQPQAQQSPWVQQIFGIAGRLLPDEFHSAGLTTYLWDGNSGALTLLGWALLAWATIPERPRNHALRNSR